MIPFEHHAELFTGEVFPQFEVTVCIPQQKTVFQRPVHSIFRPSGRGVVQRCRSLIAQRRRDFLCQITHTGIHPVARAVLVRKPSKNVDCVVAICIGMNLPPELSNALISKSGFTLRLAQNEAHLMYNFFLNHLYMGSIHECNDYLVARNLPVMTSAE